MNKLSRRSLMRSAIGAAAIATTPLPAETPAAQTAATPGQSTLLATARASVADNAKALSTVALPQSTEPAFSFKA